jgi:hypothetical protein
LAKIEHRASISFDVLLVEEAPKSAKGEAGREGFAFAGTTLGWRRLPVGYILLVVDQ